ncbi:unnamed protein product [Sphagnum jensenii]
MPSSVPFFHQTMDPLTYVTSNFNIVQLPKQANLPQLFHATWAQPLKDALFRHANLQSEEFHDATTAADHKHTQKVQVPRERKLFKRASYHVAIAYNIHLQKNHRHYLRDRKNRKRIEDVEDAKAPAIIPLSDSDTIQLTLTEELDVWHLIVQLPLINESEQYLCISLQLDALEVSEYVDVWGKVLWASKTQLNSKVVKRTTKRVSDSPTTAVKMKVLEVESDIFVDLFISRSHWWDNPRTLPATLQNVFYRLHTTVSPSPQSSYRSRTVGRRSRRGCSRISRSSAVSSSRCWRRRSTSKSSCTVASIGCSRGNLSTTWSALMWVLPNTNVDYRSESEERFIDLQLSVEGTGNLLESLNHYTATNCSMATTCTTLRSLGNNPPAKVPPGHATLPSVRRSCTPRREGFSGHYYAYLRLRGKWYKFNDEVVKESSEKEVFEFNFGGQLTVHELDSKELIIMEKTVPVNSTAYMLVYCSTEEEARIFAEDNFVPQWLKE